MMIEFGLSVFAVIALVVSVISYVIAGYWTNAQWDKSCKAIVRDLQELNDEYAAVFNEYAAKHTATNEMSAFIGRLKEQGHGEEWNV